MVVNSDDGFQASVGTTNNPTQVILGKYDGGRGATDSQFYFKVDKAGVYFFRLLYFEGTGGASVEWFTVSPGGSKALVGGSQAGALKAYRNRTVAEPSRGNTGGGTISSVRLDGDKIEIMYTGTLKSSSSVSGPYTAIMNATSPYSVAPTGSALFFLVQ